MWKHQVQVGCIHRCAWRSDGANPDEMMHSTGTVQPRGGEHAPCVIVEQSPFAWVLVLRDRKQMRLVGVRLSPRNKR